MPPPSDAPAAAVPLLRLAGLGISFGATRALDDVSFELHAGEVHLLAGENGAGKSTLIKILAGIHPGHDGTITLAGRRVRFASPREAAGAGIAVIHQELSLVDAMSVTDNLFLGRERTRGGGGWLDRRAQVAAALAQCRELDLDLTPADLDRPVETFSLSEKNRLEIAKALGREVRILVLDEPTSALNRHEVERLFVLIARLKARGVGLIYISHRMEEIYRIADRITVLRDGRRVGTATRAECPPETLVRWMIGRELAQYFPARPAREGRNGRKVKETQATALAVRDLRVAAADPARPDVLRGVSLTVRPGEIVGLAGLQGAGATELLHMLFGAGGRPAEGEVSLAGEPYVPSDPAAAIGRGLALLTGDRKATGLLPGLSITHNTTLAALPRFSPGGVLRPREERAAAGRQVAALHVRCASVEQAIGTLSGGNQQKVLLGRWLETRPRVLLLDEPTRGVDVGAKHEIYELMNRWTAEGVAILMFSTDLPELLGMSDRVVVLHRGAITAEFARAEATAARVLAAAMGAAENGGAATFAA
jgi:ribose transport system ATP-binding protein